MKKSRLLGIVVMLLQLAVFIPTGFSREGDPNFILINTDDMNAPEIAFMPNVLDLAQQGVTFTSAFVTTSVCSPSRASLLRGQYAHNTGLITNTAPDGGFEEFRRLGLENSTISTWLQSFLQYRTGLIGKYMNGYGEDTSDTYIPPGWDSWYAMFNGQRYFDYSLNENGTIVEYGSAEEDYQTDVLANFALEFVQSAATDSRSFFLYLAPGTPHRRYIPAPRHEDAFPEITGAPRLASFNEADVSDKPLWLQENSLLSETTIAAIDENYRKRLQMLLAVDEMVGNLVTELMALGILDNTYIIFTSDNGWLQGEHRLEGKGAPYEEAIRVPLVVRGPGVAANEVRDQIVAQLDLAPTITDLVVSRTHPQVDGRSLAQLLGSNPPQLWRSQILVEYVGDGIRVPEYNAMRTEKGLYVEWPLTGEIELYDMTSDPAQIESIHSTAPPFLLDRYSSDLQALVECRQQSCRGVDH